jgi:UDP-N-acetylenolpyruvoylglucosamine reductase
MNREGASIDHIISLAHDIRRSVHLRFSIWLEMELIFFIKNSFSPYISHIDIVTAVSSV